MKEIITPEVVSLIITSVIVPLLIKAINLAAKFIDSKIENDKASKYICAAENVFETVVEAVGQSFVDDLKKSGKWDQTAKEKAFNNAKTIILKSLGDGVKNELTLLHGDIDSFIDSKIDYYIKKGKLNSAQKETGGITQPTIFQAVKAAAVNPSDITEGQAQVAATVQP